MVNASATLSLRMSRRLITACSIAAVVLAASAPTAHGEAVARSKLWATINVCDTAAHPNTIGIRASMPGARKRGERLFMRFQVQFYRPASDSWHHIGPSADSGFVPVGSRRSKAGQSGRNFTLQPPPRRASHVVRGLVTFEWRRGGEVAKRAVRVTRAGRPNTVGADPPEFSAATCEIR